MPSVVLAILLHTWIASDKCEIYSQRQRTQSPYPRIYLAYVFTYADAKVQQKTDMHKACSPFLKIWKFFLNS